MKAVKLNVPYSSQFLDVEDHFWNIRSCGGTCIKMCLDYYHNLDSTVDNSPSILHIMNGAFNNGGYDANHGFVHDFAVKYFLQHNLDSHRMEGLSEFETLKASLDNGNPIIVSVVKRTLEQEKFHLILVVGYEEDDDGRNSRVIYHEPESTDPNRGAYRVCDMDTFLKSWRGKAIFVKSK